MSYTCKYTFAVLPRTQRGSPIVLGCDPKGKNMLYTSGNSVIIRSIEHPEIADIYTEHSAAVLVAKYSPSGFYIASADATGKVRIWDTVNAEHILKNEFQPLSGPIKDLAWSPDSQRIAVGGEGREKFGHVFMVDTGTSVGEITGQTKQINSIDFRPTRPYRVATGSEDNTVGIYEGPPFKFKCTKKEHNRFVQAVRYSPDGEILASGGFDGNVFLYRGADSEYIGELGSPAHAGGVYAVAWSSDSKQLLTASGDKTCKIWDVEQRSLVKEFPMGNYVEDQQVSCLWKGDFIISVSLSGFINYLNIENPAQPIKIVKGHNKAITSMTLSEDRTKIYTASHDGYVTNWVLSTGVNDRIGGTGHGNQVNKMTVILNKLYTCGIDDNLKRVDLEQERLTYDSNFNVKLGAQPRGMSANGQNVVIATCKDLLMVDQDGIIVKSTPIKFEPSSVAYDWTEKHIAVGSLSDNKVHIFSDEDGFVLKKSLSHSGGVTDVAYSPNGKYLVTCDTARKVVLYSLPSYELAHSKEWGFHNARVNCVAWSPNSTLVASGSLDTSIIIWSLEYPMKHLIFKCAHPQSQITSIAWSFDNQLISTGQDGNTKVWDIAGFP